MSTFEAVQRAHNVQDALLAIARGIDALRVEPAVAEDPWGIEWDAQPAQDRQRDARELTIAQLKAKLEDEKDPYERQALEAALRLAEDENRAKEDDPIEGRSERFLVDNGNVEVELPVASPEVQERRRELVERISLVDTFGDAIAESYVVGGPLLIYYSNRDYVLGLPVAIRREMINDVAEFNPVEAHEMARDVLKDASPDALRGLAEEEHDRRG